MNANDRAALACLTAILFAVIALPSFLPTLRAEDAGSAPTPATSGNAITNLLRDPFWPVGYWPKPKVADTNMATAERIEDVAIAPTPPADPPPKWPDLRVTGILGPTPSGYLATLDGIKGVVEAGQTVRRQEGIYEYSWKINSISASREVSHTRLNVRKIK